jgi:hypothetical protein
MERAGKRRERRLTRDRSLPRQTERTRRDGERREHGAGTIGGDLDTRRHEHVPREQRIELSRARNGDAANRRPQRARDRLPRRLGEGEIDRGIDARTIRAPGVTRHGGDLGEREIAQREHSLAPAGGLPRHVETDGRGRGVLGSKTQGEARRAHHPREHGTRDGRPHRDGPLRPQHARACVRNDRPALHRQPGRHARCVPPCHPHVRRRQRHARRLGVQRGPGRDVGEDVQHARLHLHADRVRVHARGRPSRQHDPDPVHANGHPAHAFEPDGDIVEHHVAGGETEIAKRELDPSRPRAPFHQRLDQRMERDHEEKQERAERSEHERQASPPLPSRRTERRQRERRLCHGRTSRLPNGSPPRQADATEQRRIAMPQAFCRELN